MATLKAATLVIARSTNLELKAATTRARALRDARLVTVEGRGRGAPELSRVELFRLLVATVLPCKSWEVRNLVPRIEKLRVTDAWAGPRTVSIARLPEKMRKEYLATGTLSDGISQLPWAAKEARQGACFHELDLRLFDDNVSASLRVLHIEGDEIWALQYGKARRTPLATTVTIGQSVFGELSKLAPPMVFNDV